MASGDEAPMKIFVHDPDPARRQRFLDAVSVGPIDPEVLASPAAVRGLAGLSEEASRSIPLVLGQQDVTLEHVTALRRSGCETPILILVDRRIPDRDAALLDAGACDVVAAPFHDREIAARLRTALRRRNNLARNDIAIGDLVVYLDGRDPEILSLPVKLSAKENAVLCLLASNQGRVLPRTAIYERLYGLSDYQPFDKAVDIHICRIRSKFARVAPEASNVIETFPRRGYALRSSVGASIERACAGGQR